MSQLQHAQSFKDLVVYRKARVVTKRMFEISKGFPREEMYSLTVSSKTVVPLGWRTDCRSLE